VTTDGSGHTTFSAVLPLLSPAGQTAITATATDPTNNTSEFSPVLQIAADQLLNISTRLRVLTDDNALIGGFIITGADPKKVIVRAIGPSLTALGVQGALADPTLELHLPDGSIVSNDNWKDPRTGNHRYDHSADERSRIGHRRHARPGCLHGDRAGQE